MARDDLMDQKWSMIGPLLLSECGYWTRPSGDNRLFFNSRRHVLRTARPLAGHA